MSQQRALMMIVGRDSPLRRAVGHQLIERGYPVVMCGGPPGCSLSREDRCALLDRVDVAVILPAPADRGVGMYLQQCARQARRAILAEDPGFDVPAAGVIVGSTSAAKIAQAAAAIAHPGAA